MTFTIKTPRVPKFINTKVLLVALAVLVIVGFVIAGVVAQVRADRADAAQAVATAQAEAEKQQAVQSRIASLEAQVAGQSKLAADKQAVCLYVAQLDAIAAITARVTVPVQCK